MPAVPGFTATRAVSEAASIASTPAGDYKNPPPQGEHAGLYHYHLNRSQPPTCFDADVRPRIGNVLVRWFLDAGHQLLVASVSKTHAHLLVELPSNLTDVKRIVGEAKTRASRAVKDSLPGSIWGEGGDFEPVLTAGHLHNALKYIRDEQEPGAWKWTAEDAPPPPLPPSRAPRHKKRRA